MKLKLILLAATANTGLALTSIAADLIGDRLNVGTAHSLEAVQSTIGGGQNNTIQTNAIRSTIGGGVFNKVEDGASQSVIGGGGGNIIGTNARNSTIAGGHENIVQPEARYSTIAGGDGNSILSNALYSTIGGGRRNLVHVSAHESTIAGGTENNIQSDSGLCTISGGGFHTIQTNAFWSTIGGGAGNVIQANAKGASIGAGVGNLIERDATYSSISGGEHNTNQAGASFSVISGGRNNTIGRDAAYAVIPGGLLNEARASYALAAGYGAKALHLGTFIWADPSTGENFSSTAPYQFLIRASGGMGIGTASPEAQLDVTSTAPDVLRVSGGPNATLIKFNAASSDDFVVGTVTSLGGFGCKNVTDDRYDLFVAGDGNVGIGTTSPQAKLDVNGKVNCTVLELTSDRNQKQDFAAVDAGRILEQLVTLPIQTWAYTNESKTRHIGPMAQDWKAAYPELGSDDKHIATIDADGVALASIQALFKIVKDKDTRIAALEQKLTEQEQSFTARFRAMENFIARIAATTSDATASPAPQGSVLNSKTDASRP